MNIKPSQQNIALFYKYYSKPEKQTNEEFLKEQGIEITRIALRGRLLRVAKYLAKENKLKKGI